MQLSRRYLFHATASALSGRIYRPQDIVLESGCASALTVAGGRHVSRVGAKQFGDVVRFGAAFTSAEGVFDDAKRAVEMTYGRVAQETLTATTVVTSELQDLVLGVGPRLTVGHLRGTLNAKSPAAGGQPPISVASDTVIEGVSVEGRQLLIELNLSMYQRCATLAQLLTAVDDPSFVAEHGECLFMPSALDRLQVAAGRLVEGRGLVYGTIVKSMRWAGEPYPGAEIEQNVLTVPDIGKIFFGEILVGESHRRLTMIRFDLGSPDGGNGAGGEGQTSGGFSP